MAVRARTIFLALFAILVLVVLGGISAVGWQVVLGPHARPVSARKFEVTDARLARGKYLAEGPAACFHCHSEHDFSTPTYPTIPEKKGAGWVMPIPELNNIASRNITPDPETGIGAWSDDEVARAIREGVRKDGTALFPVMPYMNFRHLDDADVEAIVVYLRTIPPVRNRVPDRHLPFPLEYIVKTIPAPLEGPQPSHPASTPVERGQYIATIASCGECHTASDDRGQPLPNLEFGGGGEFSDPGQNGKKVYSLNITPDPSGIAHYDLALFKELMHTGAIQGRIVNHIMPLEYFRNINDDDLGDLFAYLQSLKPVKHRISNTDPPAMCVLCKHEHGLGELNK